MKYPTCHYCGESATETDLLELPNCWDCFSRLKKTKIKLLPRRVNFIKRQLNEDFKAKLQVIPYWGNLNQLGLSEEMKARLSKGHEILDQLARRIQHRVV